MTKVQKWSSLGICLAILSLVALALQYLALCDIAKGAKDLALEWRIVGISMMVLTLFVASALVFYILVGSKER